MVGSGVAKNCPTLHNQIECYNEQESLYLSTWEHSIVLTALDSPHVIALEHNRSQVMVIMSDQHFNLHA